LLTIKNRTASSGRRGRTQVEAARLRFGYQHADRESHLDEMPITIPGENLTLGSANADDWNRLIVLKKSNFSVDHNSEGRRRA
jgi:hypothetical protein